MAHPYRTRHSVPPEGPGGDPRFGAPTLAFGVVCVFCGLTLAGSSRPYMALVVTVVGPVVIATQRRT